MKKKLLYFNRFSRVSKRKIQSFSWEEGSLYNHACFLRMQSRIQLPSTFLRVTVKKKRCFTVLHSWQMISLAMVLSLLKPPCRFFQKSPWLGLSEVSKNFGLLSICGFYVSPLRRPEYQIPPQQLLKILATSDWAPNYKKHQIFWRFLFNCFTLSHKWGFSGR